MKTYSDRRFQGNFKARLKSGGSSSGVERVPPKDEAEGSNPFCRSKDLIFRFGTFIGPGGRLGVKTR